MRWGLIVFGMLMIVGCGPGSDTIDQGTSKFPGVSITLTVAGDLAILDYVRPWRATWEEETGGKVAVVEQPVIAGKLGGAEVILFPGDRMGELVDADDLAILLDTMVRPPIPLGYDQPPPDLLAFNDVVPAYRDQVSKYGDDRMGLPLGGSALVLAYRRDVFESSANIDAAKAAGITLQPPGTWDELDALARFFHGRDWGGKEGAKAGIVAPLGDDPDGVADATLIARSAAGGLDVDHVAFLFDPETLAPRLDTPPFVEALQALAAWAPLGPEGMADFNAEAARKAFRDGKAPLLIDRAERAGRWTDPKSPITVGVVPLPGSRRVYDPDRKLWQEVSTVNRPAYLPIGGGWLVGISATASGKKRDAAVSLARSLAGPEASRGLVSSPGSAMVPIRGAQLGGGLPDPRSARGVDSRGWGIAVSQTVTAPRVMPGLRIPHASEYLAALTRARRDAVRGAPPGSTLAAAGREWSALSEKFGVKRQLWHYRRGLNALITATEPPDRNGSQP